MPLYGQGFNKNLGFEIRNSQEYFNITDPAQDAAVETGVIDIYDGVVVTLTGANTPQTLQAPTATNNKRSFTVVNSENSTQVLTVNNVTIQIGDFHVFIWEGTNWDYDHFTLLTHGSLSTCLLSGCNISINATNDSQFDISSGTYAIVDLDDGVLKPRIEIINFPGVTGYTPTNLDKTGTTVGLDRFGNVVEKNISPFDKGELRIYAVVGFVFHANGVNITDSLRYTTTPRGNLASNIYDIANIFENVNYRGSLNVIPNGANLKINISEGTYFRMGINPDSTYTPNFIESPELIATPFLYAFSTTDGNGTKLGPLPSTQIIPSVYDDGTATQADSIPNGVVQNNKYSIQHIYYNAASNIVGVQFGQNVYDNVADAIANREFDLAAGTEQPNLRNILKISYMIIKGGATDLSDPNQCTIIQAPITRGIGGGGTGTGTTSLQRAYENSEINPEILLNATNGPLGIRSYSGGDDACNIEIQKNDGTQTACLHANGIMKLTLPTYADDTAAGVGGLTAGYMYKTATGEVRIKL